MGIFDGFKANKLIKNLNDILRSGHDDVNTPVARDARVGRGKPAALIQALKDEDDTGRAGAAKGLGNIGDERAVEPLLQALKDDEVDDVQESAVEALEKIGGVRAEEALIWALKSESIWVRLGAAKGLGKIGGVRAVESLIQTLKDDEWYTYNSQEEEYENQDYVVKKYIEAIKNRESIKKHEPVHDSTHNIQLKEIERKESIKNHKEKMGVGIGEDRCPICGKSKSPSISCPYCKDAAR